MSLPVMAGVSERNDPRECVEMVHFVEPVAVTKASEIHVVSDTDTALDWLRDRWPTFRGPRHADAFASVMLARLGREAADDARAAFVAAAKEADIFVQG